MAASASSWRQSRWKWVQVAAIGAIGWPVLEWLAGTYEYRVTGRHHLDVLEAEGPAPIITLWHGRILPIVPMMRDHRVIALVSENFDGEWIARIITRFGYGSARGSSSRGGARALVQLRRVLADGYPALFTLDGPRGPARVAQRGALWLAGATGHPILPFHFEANRAWTAKSWDRHLIPKPGATINGAIGEPLYVANTEVETLESARLTLEARLGALEDSLLPHRAPRT